MPYFRSPTGHVAGEEGSSTYEGRHLTFYESELTHPSRTSTFVNKGDPVLAGENIVGVSFGTAVANTDPIAIDTEGCWYLTVYATDEAGGSAVAVGDQIFIHKTSCVLSKNNNKNTHQSFGYALSILASGSGVVKVKVHWDPDDAVERVGTSAVPMAINTADFMGYRRYYSSSATSGTTYGDYLRLDAGGAGLEAIAGRSKVLLTANSVGNAHGAHDTLELDATLGSITGLGTGHRANLVLPARAVLGGTYFGAMSEIYCNGAGATIAGVTKHAVHEISVAGADATAMNTVKNAISFDHGGTDGTGQMIYTHNPGNTFSGAIRILVNGAAKWLYFASAE